MKSIFIVAILLFLIACTKDSKPEIYEDIKNTNLKYFGFTLIDVFWDDPTDAEIKTNYSDEVHTFSNVADILVIEPTDNIIERLNTMNSYGMKAILHLHFLFFEEVGAAETKSGFKYDLRADYQERWDLFATTNNLVTNWDLIQAFYIGEEPLWNDIDFNELKSACDYLKSTFPEVKVMVVEAFPVINDLVVPESVDWLGFDHYFIKNPESDNTYLSEYNLLKSKRSNTDQEMILIMDAHFIQFAHGSSGIAKTDLEGIATQFYNLANNDNDVAAILGYFWPSGFDATGSIGARHLPEKVKEEYERIGKTITGK